MVNATSGMNYHILIVLFKMKFIGVKKSSELSKLVKSVKIPYKFRLYTVRYQKNLLINGILKEFFGPVVDEIKIQELQEKNVLADVSITPIKFIHALKENFRKPSERYY